MNAAAEDTVRDPIPGALRYAGLGVACLASMALLARAVMIVGGGPWPWYVGLWALYIALFAVTMLRPPARPWRSHVLLAGECAVVLTLLSIDPELDFMTSLFAPLALLAALLFAGRTMWYWVAALAVLTAGPLMLYLGALRGLSLAFVTVAAEVVFASFVVFTREIEAARRQSQSMLLELLATHRRLKAYAAQAGELAAVDERGRVARDLNDSVAQTVSGILQEARSAREALATAEADTSADQGIDEAARRVAALQGRTQQALVQMRGLVAELHPKGD